jgi:hypothetical protein
MFKDDRIWTLYDGLDNNRVVAITKTINGEQHLVLLDETKQYPITLFGIGKYLKKEVSFFDIMERWFPIRGLDPNNVKAPEILKEMGLDEYIRNTVVYMTNAKALNDPFWIDFGDGELSDDFVPDPNKKYNVPYRMKAIK